ncbi:MAG: hypothetical protein K6G65_04350 [Lachnospiraceae bacterium]|nr:hypothetical protein [Lachnospiraceae bacterium]
MIEITENALQLLCAVYCVLISIRHSDNLQKRSWTMLALASGGFFLGDLYWQLYLVFYHDTPHYSYIPYLSWYASYLFLLLLIFEIREEHTPKVRNPFLWLIPAFTSGMCIFYLQWGDWIGNISAAVLMSFLMWYAAKGVMLSLKYEEYKKYLFFYILILAFCLLEYSSWTISIFWMGDTFLNPYFWSDTMLSITFLFFPMALRKAVEE